MLKTSKVGSPKGGRRGGKEENFEFQYDGGNVEERGGIRSVNFG